MEKGLVLQDIINDPLRFIAQCRLCLWIDSSKKQMEIFIASVLFPLTCLFPGKSKEVSLEKQDLSLFFCPRFTGRIT